MAYAYKGNDFKEPEYLNEPLGTSKCGSYAGYRWHINNGDPVCDDCTDAHADYMRDYMRNYRAQRQAA